MCVCARARARVCVCVCTCVCEEGIDSVLHGPIEVLSGGKFMNAIVAIYKSVVGNQPNCTPSRQFDFGHAVLPSINDS